MKVYWCKGVLRPKVKRYWIRERYPQRTVEGQDRPTHRSWAEEEEPAKRNWKGLRFHRSQKKKEEELWCACCLKCYREIEKGRKILVEIHYHSTCKIARPGVKPGACSFIWMTWFFSLSLICLEKQEKIGVSI